MWWLFIILIVIMIYSKLDDVIEVFKNNDPNYIKEKEKQQRVLDNERQEIVQQLKTFIGLECQIESEYFYFMSKPAKLQVEIKAVDDDWVEFITKQKKAASMIIKIEDVTSVSKIL